MFGVLALVPSLANMTDIALLQILKHIGFEGWAILGLLALLSVVTLAVALQKWREFQSREAHDAAFLKAMAQVKRFDDLVKAVAHTRGVGLRSLAEAALVEDEILGVDAAELAGAEVRGQLVQEACERAAEEEFIRLESRLSWLVVAAGTGPFLGLLGTVWGIMDAFFRIGSEGSAALNVVAPGIAEALLTTLAGLLVAIPAAAAHQLLSGRLRRLEGEHALFASKLGSLYRRSSVTGAR